MKGHYYFAYGSCMCQRDLERTTPCDVVSPATVYDYRLAFTRYSTGRKGGVADIVWSAGDYLEGMLFMVYDLKKLDIREGHPSVYKRQKITVFNHDTMKYVDAWTYMVVNKEEFEIRPSKNYVSLIREGAEQLSHYYRQDLEENLKKYRPPYHIDTKAEDRYWDIWRKGLKERMGTDE